MTDDPMIVERAAQPYVGVRGLVTMSTIPEIADRIPEIFAGLAARDTPPAGAPFLKYNVIDMERELEIEAGVPVAVPVAVPDPLFCAVLPAGRYVRVVHVGHPGELVDVTARLLDWARRQGLAWDVSDTPRGQRWGARLETYHTDPRVEPDPAKWETELAFRLA